MILGLDTLIDQSMDFIIDDHGIRYWKCKVCGKTNKDKTNIRRHMEKHVEGFQHNCENCCLKTKGHRKNIDNCIYVCHLNYYLKKRHFKSLFVTLK